MQVRLEVGLRIELRASTSIQRPAIGRVPLGAEGVAAWPAIPFQTSRRGQGIHARRRERARRPVAGDALEPGVQDAVGAVAIELPRRGRSDDADRGRADGAGHVIAEAVRRQAPVGRRQSGRQSRRWSCRCRRRRTPACDAQQPGVERLLARPADERDGRVRPAVADETRQLGVVPQLPALLRPARPGSGVEADARAGAGRLPPKTRSAARSAALGGRNQGRAIGGVQLADVVQPLAVGPPVPASSASSSRPIRHHDSAAAFNGTTPPRRSETKPRFSPACASSMIAADSGSASGPSARSNSSAWTNSR